MTDASSRQILRDRLASELGPTVAESLVTHLVQETGKPDVCAQVLTLLDELEELSEKAACAGIGALPELDRRGGLSHVLMWLDLGVALTESSGASALKYFKESPVVLGVIERPKARSEVLTIGLEIAEQDANVTLEFMRQAPQIVATVPSDQLRRWLNVGIELTQVNVVVGLEFIRHISTLVSILPLEYVRSWAQLGMRLVGTNSLGKPDYMATMEFLRTSPMILRDIEDEAVRGRVISLCLALADHSPEASLTWMVESPQAMRVLPSTEWQTKVLQYGVLLAENDAETTVQYLRRAPELVGLIGDVPEAVSRFESWFKAGMEVLAYSPEGARAYFAVESQKALGSVEVALSGVPFRQVARRVKLFVQGLCGTEVAVAALQNSVISQVRATVSADGRTISLPALLRRYPTEAENERLYFVMAAHEAGHLEFGTYGLKLESLADLVDAVQHRYGQSQMGRPDTLAAFFEYYPHPALVRDLWTVLEDARVESLLQTEYPGLRPDLVRLAGDAITPRDPALGVTAKELMVDCLLRLSTGETEETVVPRAVKEEVSILWGLCQSILKPTATAEATVRLVDAVYARMEELLAARGEMMSMEQQEEAKELETRETRPEQSGETYQAVADVAYRGAMHPEFVTWSEERVQGQSVEPGQLPNRERPGNEARRESSAMGSGHSLQSVVEECLAVEGEQQPLQGTNSQDERVTLYPEWDCRIEDYRPNWCRVVEQPAECGSDEFVSTTLATHQSTVKYLRRFFEHLRPSAFRRIAGQMDGEDVDLDAVVRRTGEQRAGAEGDDHVYIRREKHERDVAVAFLVDISGSTSRTLDNGRRVIDIEKEGLVLLCEALEAVGDQYGLYAYSSQGRAQVEFLTIKDFDDRLGAATAHRLGSLTSRHQNRDGAAIRHATTKLMARAVKTRILIILSDGRPLDEQYKDDYALEDTKAALREAKQRGVETFCVTVDKEADNYLRRMYGEVHYRVIDSINALPTKLPRIYRQLTA
ncbi:MAG TPA: VWA domain-containing protein [Nitrospira sp.]|nr:VWA domain-containing protein [Nitrospira sp.]